MYLRRLDSSLRQQARRCMRHINHRRYSLMAIVEDDTRECSGLLDAIQMVRDGHADVIVVADLSTLCDFIELAGEDDAARAARPQRIDRSWRGAPPDR